MNICLYKRWAQFLSHRSSLIMAEIEIFLNIDETQMPFLSIPCSDIERLIISPFQWIHYVMFTICGARGDLSTTHNSPAVDYKTIKFPMTQTPTTIGLLVSFFFVCEIALQCLDFSRWLCLCRLWSFKWPNNNYRRDSMRQRLQRQCYTTRWTCLCC